MRSVLHEEQWAAAAPGARRPGFVGHRSFFLLGSLIETTSLAHEVTFRSACPCLPRPNIGMMFG